jgi:hypothetical protein
VSLFHPSGPLAGGFVLVCLLAGPACGRDEVPTLALTEPADVMGTVAAPTALDPCDLVRLPQVAADPVRRLEYREVAEAAVPEAVDDRAWPGPDEVFDVSTLAAVDRLWDALDHRCGRPDDAGRCRNLVVASLADPFGRLAAGEPAPELAAAFELAVANLTEVRDLAGDAALVRALDVHVAALDAARSALAAGGWGADDFAALDAVAGDLVALGEPEVVEPLLQLQHDCGLG